MGNKQDVEITLVGLKSSGKTCIANALRGEIFTEDTIPTVGFNMFKDIETRKSKMKIWDMGGSDRFCAMWSRYCRNNDAIIFCIDSCTKNNNDIGENDILDTIRQKFEMLFTESVKETKDIPILILFTKCDMDNAKSKDLVEKLNFASYNDTIFKNRKVGSIQVSSKTNHDIDKIKHWLDECKEPFVDYDRKTLCHGYCKMFEKKYQLQFPPFVGDICAKYFGVDRIIFC